MNPPATKADLERLHLIFLIELAAQGLIIIGVLAAIYFGNVASNQAAGSLGMSMGQAIEQSRSAFHDDMVRELDRRDEERERRERERRRR